MYYELVQHFRISFWSINLVSFSVTFFSTTKKVERDAKDPVCLEAIWRTSPSRFQTSGGSNGWDLKGFNEESLTMLQGVIIKVMCLFLSGSK